MHDSVVVVVVEDLDDVVALLIYDASANCVIVKLRD
jgi:hypothetical protein